MFSIIINELIITLLLLAYCIVRHCNLFPFFGAFDMHIGAGNRIRLNGDVIIILIIQVIKYRFNDIINTF